MLSRKLSIVSLFALGLIALSVFCRPTGGDAGRTSPPPRGVPSASVGAGLRDDDAARDELADLTHLGAELRAAATQPLRRAKRSTKVDDSSDREWARLPRNHARIPRHVILAGAGLEAARLLRNADLNPSDVYIPKSARVDLARWVRRWSRHLDAILERIGRVGDRRLKDLLRAGALHEIAPQSFTEEQWAEASLKTRRWNRHLRKKGRSDLKTVEMWASSNLQKLRPDAVGQTARNGRAYFAVQSQMPKLMLIRKYELEVKGLYLQFLASWFVRHGALGISGAAELQREFREMARRAGS